jgi:hypothetical protein
MTLETEAGIFFGVIVSILIRMFTGYTPLRWIALLLLYAEAGIEQGIITFGFAVEHYATHYRMCLSVIRSNIAMQVARGEDV